MSSGTAAYTTCLFFLFGCVSRGVNVNETFLLQCDWRHSASLTIQFTQHEFLQGTDIRLLLYSVYLSVCMSFCVHVQTCMCLHMFMHIAVPVANIANHGWLFVTVLLQGNLWVDWRDKHMMWLWIRTSLDCMHTSHLKYELTIVCEFE